MTDLHLCPRGWELYDKWDTFAEIPDPTPEQVVERNRAWLALKDHEEVCKECKK
jgi:hypothetical protein